MPSIIRWRPLPGHNIDSIDTVVDHVDEDGQKVYRAWPAGRPEPSGNPIRWSESTLRHHYEKDGEGAGKQSSE